MVKYAALVCVVLAVTVASVGSQQASAVGDGYTQTQQWFRSGMVFTDKSNQKFRLRAIGVEESCDVSNGDNNPKGNPCMKWAITKLSNGNPEATFSWPVLDWSLVEDAAGGRRLLQLPTTCNVLNLVLGPLHLDLLGLIIDLNQVVLTITAAPGGGLLGSLLCSLTAPSTLFGLLSQLFSLLNAAG